MELRLLIFALISFALSLLYFMVILFDSFQLSEFYYFIASLSVGFYFLTLRNVKLWKSSPSNYKKPTIKSVIITRLLLALFIVIDLGLFYCYIIDEPDYLRYSMYNLKDYYGVYLLIVTSWIGIVYNFKN